MTHYEKLDMILNGLLFASTQPRGNNVLTFEFFCSTLLKNEDVTKWESDFIQERLIKDGYIKLIEKNSVAIPEITHEGIKFIQDGGYKKEQERKNMQDELVKTSIESNKRSKWAFVVSIASFLVALAALIIGLLNKE